MNNIDLEKQIIELIPSKTMRDAIKENNHKFTDIEYVQLVEEYSKSWENKLNLLKQIKENISNQNLISYINAYVESEINAYNKFTKKEENYVYDVIMDHKSNYEGERFLCSSFDSIMKVIESYKENYKEYINVDNLKNIEIVKRKISNWGKSKEIDENENIIVYLNENMEINCIYDDNYVDPEDYNLEMKCIKYPTIFKAGELVYIDKSKYNLRVANYCDYYYSIADGKKYGLVGFNQNEIDEDGDIDVCYFLDLSNEFVNYRSIGVNEQQYVNYLDCHDHIDFGYIEKVDLNEVHPKIKDDYEYAKAKLIELGIIK